MTTGHGIRWSDPSSKEDMIYGGHISHLLFISYPFTVSYILILISVDYNSKLGDKPKANPRVLLHNMSAEGLNDNAAPPHT